MSEVTTNPESAETPLRLRPGWLLAVYGIIPLTGLFILIDYQLLDMTVSRNLPTDPHRVQWFNLFFMLPHIFASMFTFLDPEYIQAYRRRMALSVPAIILVAAAVPAIFGTHAFLVAIAVYTVYHLMSQQAGVAAIIARNKSLAHFSWKWVSFALITVLYLVVIGQNDTVRSHLSATIEPLLLIFLMLTIITAAQSNTGFGSLYFAANFVMAAVMYALYRNNLPFFLVLIPRFIHDVTAFTFYICHNANRNRKNPNNYLSRLWQMIGIPEFIATPVFGILCAGLVLYVFDEFMWPILCFLGLFHYYWEGVMWKAGKPHRDYIFT